jgi:hypothetical protein
MFTLLHILTQNSQRKITDGYHMLMVKQNACIILQQTEKYVEDEVWLLGQSDVPPFRGNVNQQKTEVYSRHC